MLKYKELDTMKTIKYKLLTCNCRLAQTETLWFGSVIAAKRKMTQHLQKKWFLYPITKWESTTIGNSVTIYRRYYQGAVGSPFIIILIPKRGK